MKTPTPDFKANSVVTVNFDGGSSLTLIVTQVSKTSEGARFSGYDPVNGHDYKNIAYNAGTAKHIIVNLKAQEALPKPGTYVTINQDGKTIRGVIKSFRRGKFDVLYEGLGATVPEKRGHITVAEHPFDDTSDKNSVMAAWSVSSYREFSSRSKETACFNAKVGRGGKVLLHVENDGNGGCDMVTPTGQGTRADMDQFLESCAQWAADYGGEYTALEPYSHWLGWEQLYRPFGRSEADYFTELKEYDDALRAGL
ncbi:hypothetical protein AA14337_3108 [Acetobacter malorum DSM 14337]|uniref:Uncharacterized protein n=1 Tax=Acetobacter malorum DSM 14337 TaxID=1307910 RepID=A0ABQ0PZP8_9PROT|nr:hypothetical protein [Acetobacter malorum]KXV05690.1 hypothetical protein AD930_11190 [Acetobacter malorum]GBQ85578.1 hypothetical protein AA14337_3108 [Acetobacter malorum DSM 14337]